MAYVAPESTAFERSEAWRITNTKDKLLWRQDWVPYAQISNHLKRAVIASEDDIFAQHDGVQWDAIEKAWAKNAKADSLFLQVNKHNNAYSFYVKNGFEKETEFKFDIGNGFYMDDYVMRLSF